MQHVERMVAFAKVVESQGFSAAARALGTSKSHVSKQVSALEAQLGVRLLHRTTRRSSVTEAGAMVYEHCARIVAEIQAASEVATRLHAEPSGTLRISAPVSFAAFHLAPALDAFLQLHPRVRVDLDTSDRPVDLADEGFDLAFRITSRPSPGLVARKLLTVTWVTCASPAYLARRGVPKTPADLRDHNCLSYNGQPATVGWHYGVGRDAVTIQPAGTIRANQVTVLHQLALGGLGLLHLPRYVVEADLRAGRLVEVLADLPGGFEDSALYAVWLPNRYLPPKVRAFVDFMFARFAGADAPGRSTHGSGPPTGGAATR